MTIVVKGQDEGPKNEHWLVLAPKTRFECFEKRYAYKYCICALALEVMFDQFSSNFVNNLYRNNLGKFFGQMSRITYFKFSGL